VGPFPAMARWKPEQLEIKRLRRKIVKLKAERDILKNRPGFGPPVRGRNGLWYVCGRRISGYVLTTCWCK
jgi:hypothetical protein